MQISNTNQNNPNFGMALFMNEAQIEKALGPKVANLARQERSELEELAKDVDIFVTPEIIKKINLKKSNLNHLLIKVQGLTPLPEKAKNTYERIFVQPFRESAYANSVRQQHSVTDRVFQDHYISGNDSLVKSTRKCKKKIPSFCIMNRLNLL